MRIHVLYNYKCNSPPSSKQNFQVWKWLLLNIFLTYQNISESVLIKTFLSRYFLCWRVPTPLLEKCLDSRSICLSFFFKFNLIYYFHRFPLHIFSRLVHFYPSFGNKLKYNRATCIQFNKQSRNRKAELHDKYTNFLFIVICTAGKVIRHNTISCRC